MTTQHTPGPWVWMQEYGAYWVLAHENLYKISGQYVLDNGAGDGLDSNIDVNGPDARLIAAAPDLLEALRAMVEMMDCGDESGAGSEWHTKARAAIAKATGVTK